MDKTFRCIHRWWINSQEMTKVIISWLRTGYCRLRHHLYHKMKIGSTDLCNCFKEHMSFRGISQRILPDLIYLKEKLFNNAVNQSWTTTFVRESLSLMSEWTKKKRRNCSTHTFVTYQTYSGCSVRISCCFEKKLK